MAVTTEILHNRYARGRILGSGGMGEVFEGYDRLLTREVALKVLRSLYVTDPLFLKRFEREAQAAAALAHPNIVGVYDFGVHDDSPFIVMEYVRGRTLREVLDSDGKLDPERAIRLGIQVCSALTVAHERGIVHRDVKPSNIMLTDDEHVKVLDFGIAQPGGLDKITTPSAVLGTAKYISPEHAARLDVDHRSDLYSLGVCLYEMLTGRAPFQDLLPVAIVYCHVNEPPRPPRELNKAISEELETVVLRALAKKPDDRYQNAEELAEDLERVAHGWPLAAPTVATSLASMLDRGANGTGTKARRDPGQGPAITARALQRWKRAGRPAKDTTPAPPAGQAPPAATSDPKGRRVAGAAGSGSLPVRQRPDVWAAQPRSPGDPPAAPTTAAKASGHGTRQRRWLPLAAFAALLAVTLLIVVPYSLSRARTPARHPVPNVVGMTLPDALTWLGGAGLTNVDVQPLTDRSRPEVKVVAQRPGPGVSVPDDYLITLEVVEPGDAVVIPDVRGKTIAAAQSALEGAGLVVFEDYQWQTDSAVENFHVIGTNPAAGSRKRAGDGIRLVVSSGAGGVQSPADPGGEGVQAPAGATTTTRDPAQPPVTERPETGEIFGGGGDPLPEEPSPTAPPPTLPSKPTATGGDDHGPGDTTRPPTTAGSDEAG